MSNHDSTVELPDDDSTVPAGKGHPTPKRKAQEAANRRPLVMDPKADAKARREKARQSRAKENTALSTGDERNYPAEHRGPEKAYIRDFIDARRSLAEWAVPVMLFFVVVTLFVGDTAIATLAILFFYLIILGMALEVWLSTRRLKKLLEAKFGAGKLPRMWRFYAITRAMNLRAMRLPKPRVKRGEFPS